MSHFNISFTWLISCRWLNIRSFSSTYAFFCFYTFNLHNSVYVFTIFPWHVYLVVVASSTVFVFISKCCTRSLLTNFEKKRNNMLDWCCRCFRWSGPPSSPLDNIRVMVIVWRLGGNIIRTALCWIVWHNVHSPQHTYVSISYRSSRLGLSHWEPYAGCLQLYYCNMVEWFWWDSSLIYDDQLVSYSTLTLLVWSSGL